MISHWAICKISDICEIKYGKALKKNDRKEGDIPVYGSNGIVGYHNEPYIKKSTVIIGRKGSIGEIHYSDNPCWPIDTTYYLDFDAEKFSLKWFYRILKTIGLHRLNRSAAIPGLNRDDVYRIKILLPPLEDQIRIATILSRAEALIAKRKASLRLLDDLLKSTFLEMFGDPVKNEKKWDKELLSRFLKNIQSGISYGGKEKSKLENDELGVLKISAITSGHLIPSEIKAIKKEIIKKEIITLKKGMFLFSRANTRELVAACCTVNSDYPHLFLPDKLWALEINESIVHSSFLNYLFKNENFRNLLRKKATGGHDSMLNISMKKLKNTSALIPPIDLQTKFAQIVEKVEAIKVKYEASLKELENLYGSLSQRAFKGELDLSKIPVPDDF